MFCRCGEISIEGGNEQLKCFAKDWKSFLRVDDEGNEIIPKIVEKEQAAEKNSPKDPSDISKPTRSELIEMLDAMIQNIENLPKSVMDLPINHYDLYSFMLIISSTLKLNEEI